MKHLNVLRHLLICCLSIAGFLSPAIALGQISTITIAGPNPACIGSVQTYTFSPVNPDYTYTWAVTAAGNILTSGGSSAQIQWVSTGAATITVTGKDSTGTVKALGNKPVTVSALPNPVITASTIVNCLPLDEPKKDQKKIEDTSACYKVCSFSSVTYTAASHPGSTYTWTINGEVSYSSSGNTCTVNWGAPGAGSVTVTETNGSCSGSTTMCITIIEGPKADFYTNPNAPTQSSIVICKNTTVFFFDLSTTPAGSPIVSWVWDFGDGNYTSAGAGPFNGSVDHQYTVPGSYTASLTVTNSCGCSSTKKIKVKVNVDPGVVIECPRVVCEKERATYFVDKPCNPSSWKVTGGTIVGVTADRVDVVWDNVGPDGFGYVSYMGCGACPGLTVVKVPVVLQKGKISGPTSVCPNKQYLYSMPQWPTTDFEWSVTGSATLLPTDQPNEIALTTGASGSFTLSVRYCNTLMKCMGQASLTAVIMPPAYINGPQMVCKNASANYTLTGAGTATWTLTPPSGPVVTFTGSSFNPTFSLLGTYTLAISGSFCSPDPIKIKVVDKPAAPNLILGPAQACAGVPVQYTAQNPLAGTLFQWAVSSGTVNSSSGNSTFATFTGTAPYTIKVFRVTTDEAHCVSDTLTKIVTDPVPPLVVSGPDTVCGSTDWDYSLNYTGGDLYEWKIVDQSMGSVTLGNGSPGVHVLWNNPLGAGTLVKLIVKMRKCATTYYDTLNVYVMNVPTFTATASPTSVCAEQPVNFSLTGVPALTSYASISWNFGDASLPGTTPFVSHVYGSSGSISTYNPTVTVVGANGCVNTSIISTAPVTVNPTPVAYVSPAGPLAHCGAFSDNLVATVTTGFGSTTNFQWFGPTVSPPAPNCASCSTWNTVNTYGNYYVIVQNSNGCKDTSNIVKIMEICPGPGCSGTQPTLTSSTGYLTDCGKVRVEVNYNTNGTTILSEDWDYPVNATFLGQNLGTSAWLETSFTIAGSYSFFYKVTFNNGTNTCIKVFQVNVVVPYIGDMFYKINCGSGANYNVTLQDHSNIFPMPQTINHYYSYKLSSASTYTSIAVPTTALSATVSLPAGTYDIREVINNGTVSPACTTIHTIVLPPKPVADFNIVSDFMPACQRDVPIHFVNTSTPSSGVTYLWTFGDVPNTNYQQNVDRVYESATPNIKNVTLVVTNQYGCTSSKVKQVTIMPNDLWDGSNSNVLNSSPTAPCQGTPVTLQYLNGIYTMPSSFTWFQESNPMAPPTASSTFVVTQPGGYWTMGTNGYGCKSPSQFAVVNMTQVPPAVISGRPTQCKDEPFTLNGFAGNVPGLTYEWHLNGGPVIGTGPSLTQTLTGLGSYNYTLIVSVPNGSSGTCSNTSAVFVVTVNGAPPQPSVSSNIVGCAPYKIQLNASNSVAGTFNWSNGAFGTPAFGNAGGYYLCTFTDANGCTSQNSLFAEKDPSEYLWIFPTGCFCKRLFGGGGQGNPPFPVANCRENPVHITGPIVPFSYWAYLFNGGVDQSGSGLVPDYFNFLALGDGTYNLVLKNSACAVTSGNMYIGGEYCHRIGMRPGDETDIEEHSHGDATGLRLIPNPARSQTTVEYVFSAQARDRYVEVYDMVGRLIVRQKTDSREGSTVLDLSEYAAGMYQVTLKEDGRVVEQSKLSVTK